MLERKCVKEKNDTSIIDMKATNKQHIQTYIAQLLEHETLAAYTILYKEQIIQSLFQNSQWITVYKNSYCKHIPCEDIVSLLTTELEHCILKQMLSAMHTIIYTQLCEMTHHKLEQSYTYMRNVYDMLYYGLMRACHYRSIRYAFSGTFNALYFQWLNTYIYHIYENEDSYIYTQIYQQYSTKIPCALQFIQWCMLTLLARPIIHHYLLGYYAIHHMPRHGTFNQSIYSATILENMEHTIALPQSLIQMAFESCVYGIGDIVSQLVHIAHLRGLLQKKIHKHEFYFYEIDKNFLLFLLENSTLYGCNKKIVLELYHYACIYKY